MKESRIISAVAAVFMISSTAQSQGFAEAARREQARRTALTNHARVVTNEDFKNGVILRTQTQEKPPETAPAVQAQVPAAVSPVAVEPVQTRAAELPKIESVAASKAPAPSATREVTRPDTARDNTSVASLEQAYTVRRGDTLWQLAETFLGSGSRWPDIQRANGLSDPKRLRAGDRLRLPSTAMVRVTVPKARTGYVAYKVKRGESFWSISEVVLRNGASWHRLLEWNPQVGTAKQLQAGEYLYIPDEALTFGSGD